MVINIVFMDDLIIVLVGLMVMGMFINSICGVVFLLIGIMMFLFIGGEIVFNSFCMFLVLVLVFVGVMLGIYINIMGSISVDIDGNVVVGNIVMVLLFVQYVLIFIKIFFNDFILVGGIMMLEFFIINIDFVNVLIDIMFMDNILEFLSGVMIFFVLVVGFCGVGLLFFMIIVNGQIVFQVQGVNIFVGGFCFFIIDLLILNGIFVGSYINIIFVFSGNLGGSSVQVVLVMDDFLVLVVLRLVKLFIDDFVNVGDIVNLEFIFIYDEFVSGDVINVFFMDDFNVVIFGLVVVGLFINDVCGIGL